MDWWEEALCISDVQVTPEEMRALGPEGLAQLKQDLGFNLEHLAFAELSGGEGTFLRGPWRPDEYRAYLDACHRRGIRIVPYANVHWVIEPFASQHPDWLQVDERGEPVVLAYGKGNAPCLNAGWREWAIAELLRMLSDYAIDGFFLDGPTYFPRACYCAACRRRFADEHGADLPRWADRSNPAWPAFVEFRAASLARFLRDLRAALKAHRPDAVLYMNNASLGPTWPGSRDTRALAPALDVLGNERANYRDGPAANPFWMPGAATRILESQALTVNGPLPPPRQAVRRAPTLLYCCFRHLPWDYYELPPAEMRVFIGGALASGANVQIMGGLRYMSAEMRESAADLLRFYRRHADVLVGTRSLARTAIVWPQRTIDFGGSWFPESDAGTRRDWNQLVQDEFAGCYDALVRHQLPVDVLDEPALPGLTPEHYATIVLPNAECLADDAAAALRAYVERGGQLVATGFTGLADGDGRARGSFALAAVMGLSATGDLLGPLPYDYVDLDLSRLPPELPGAGLHPLIPAPERAPFTRASGARIIGRFCDKLPSRYFPTAMSADPPVAVAEHAFGEGRCLSFVGTFGASSWRYTFPDYRALLAGLAAAPARAVVAVEGVPSSVEVTHRFQPATGQEIVHLLNHTGAMDRPSGRMLPCADVRITRPGGSFERARALRAGVDLPVERDGGAAWFTLPRLEEYEVVVLS
jgi:hypothetical protein